MKNETMESLVESGAIAKYEYSEHHDDYYGFLSETLVIEFKDGQRLRLETAGDDGDDLPMNSYFTFPEGEV